ncbi:heterokaryon incompatibility protein [Stagonosporopsis vannaccii]|nr:heterokaryon incompatibility protein [Stagonosporopsis vannaccii]
MAQVSLTRHSGLFRPHKIWTVDYDTLEMRKIRWIWMDALCINQLDDEEKDVQGMNVGSIFKKAISVVAWLGSAVNNRNKTIAR